MLEHGKFSRGHLKKVLGIAENQFGNGVGVCMLSGGARDRNALTLADAVKHSEGADDKGEGGGEAEGLVCRS